MRGGCSTNLRTLDMTTLLNDNEVLARMTYDATVEMAKITELNISRLKIESNRSYS
jgi:hypothetical protein